PLTLTPPMLTNHLTYTQSLDAATWALNWFTVDVSVSRIVAKPLEKALTVAIDFAGFTSGSENSLVDLTEVKGVGSIYGYTIKQPGADPYLDDTYYSDDPYYTAAPGDIPKNYLIALSKYPEPTGGDIAATINMDFLSDLVEQQVSPQI